MVTWVLLAAAILSEVTATTALKLSDGFSRFGPTSVVIAGYAASFFLLAQILTRDVSLGVVYAIWSALGVAIIVLVDVIWFGERLSGFQVAGLFLVVVGVIALQVGGADA